MVLEATPARKDHESARPVQREEYGVLFSFDDLPSALARSEVWVWRYSVVWEREERMAQVRLLEAVHKELRRRG